MKCIAPAPIMKIANRYLEVVLSRLIGGELFRFRRRAPSGMPHASLRHFRPELLLLLHLLAQMGELRSRLPRRVPLVFGHGKSSFDSTGSTPRPIEYGICGGSIDVLLGSKTAKRELADHRHL